MDDDEVEIQSPHTIFERVNKFLQRHGEVVGWCPLCNSPIKTNADFIPGTNTHNCDKGRTMEAEAQVARESQSQSPIEDPAQNETEEQADANPPAMRQQCRSHGASHRNHDE